MTEAADGALVYDTATHRIHHLNRAATAIWRLYDGHRSIAEIARLASDATGDKLDGTTVSDAVSTLAAAGLLANGPAIAMDPATHTRRRVLKGAAAAVPVVVSITAPMAAAAESCTSGFESDCTTTRCCTGGLTCTQISTGGTFWCL